MAVGISKSIPNGQDVFGGHLFGAVDYSGPVAYNPNQGDQIDPRAFGFPNTILSLVGSLDQTSTYFVVAKPNYNGTTTWSLFWFTAATGQIVTGTPNLSGFTVRLTAIGY